MFIKNEIKFLVDFIICRFKEKHVPTRNLDSINNLINLADILMSESNTIEHVLLVAIFSNLVDRLCEFYFLIYFSYFSLKQLFQCVLLT